MSSTAIDEEGLDVQKFAKSNILWTNKVYMLSRTTNKHGGQPECVEHDYQQEMYSLGLREFVYMLSMVMGRSAYMWYSKGVIAKRFVFIDYNYPYLAKCHHLYLILSLMIYTCRDGKYYILFI